MIKTEDIQSIEHIGCKDKFAISWKMTDWCNYSCPYCITGKYCQPYLSQELMEARAKAINKIVNKIYNKQIILHCIGGEVCYYDLISILKNFNLSKINSFSIGTNFSQNINYYKELDLFLREHHIRLNILASYHNEFGSTDEFLKKILDLLNFDASISLQCGVCYNNNNIDRDFLEELLKNKVKLNLCKERTLKNENLDFSLDNHLYLADVERRDMANHVNSTQVRILTKDNQEFLYSSSAAASNDIDEGGFCPLGFKCSAGITTIRILPNGNVCRAGCNYAQNHGILGNLDIDKDIQLPKKWIVCQLLEDRKCQFCYKVDIKRLKENEV